MSSIIVVLDTGVVGAAVHQNLAVRGPVLTWIADHVGSGNGFRIPEIADYELRRELLRLNLTNSINDLDMLKVALGFIPIDTHSMLLAATLWAQTRQANLPTAHEHALDGDVILSAQAILLQQAHPTDNVVVATTNVGHLARFVPAAQWQDIGV